MISRFYYNRIILILPIVFLSIFGTNDHGSETIVKTKSPEILSDVDANLLFHWMMEKDSSTVLHDSSEHHFHGTIHGATQEKDGGHSILSFDGLDDYVNIMDSGSKIPKQLALLGQGSISVWFKVKVLPEGNAILPVLYYGARDSCAEVIDASNQGLIIELGHHPIHEESKRLYFTIWANGCGKPSFCFDSRKPINKDQWYHFIAAVGPDYNTGYLNGQEMVDRHYNFGDASHSQFFENAKKHEALWIGKGFWDAEPMYFDGLIGEIRIYRHAVNSQEALALYQQGLKLIDMDN